MSQTDLARALNIGSSTVSQYKKGDRTPPFEKMDEIAAVFGVSLLEFLSCKTADRPDIVFVEKVRARPRAGGGGLETDGEHDGYYAFHRNFIERKRGTEKGMKIFEVAGDSMSPTLEEGDFIMVNTADNEIRTGRVYLLRIGEELMVKRLERRPGNILVIRSDNPRYEDIPVNMEVSLDEVEVYGRMVWSCREY